MERRPVKKVVVHFENGEIKEFTGDDMGYKAIRNYEGGGWPSKDTLFYSHSINWSSKEP